MLPLPKLLGRTEKPILSTAIRAGMTQPTTMNVLDARPARPHETVTRAWPAGAAPVTCHFQLARPLAA